MNGIIKPFVTAAVVPSFSRHVPRQQPYLTFYSVSLKADFQQHVLDAYALRERRTRCVFLKLPVGIDLSHTFMDGLATSSLFVLLHQKHSLPQSIAAGL
jgi:hypothetical protein